MQRPAATRSRTLWLTLPALVFLAGCSVQQAELPVIGNPGTHLPGKVVWHDLVTPDLERSRAFYGDLLGWQFDEISDGYLLASNNGRPVAGLAHLESAQRSSHWLPLVSVSDIEQVQAATQGAGGSIVLAATELGGRGEVAVLQDPQGAAFAVLQSSHGDPVDGDPDVNEWMWNEIWTEDVVTSALFYQDLLGYNQGSRMVGGVSYNYLERDGRPRVGLLTRPDPQIGNTWVAYLRVADVASVVARAANLGGTVLMAPDPQVRKGTVAVLADPNGAGFIVQEWPL